MKSHFESAPANTSVTARKRTLAYAKEALEFAELNQWHACNQRDLPLRMLAIARRKARRLDDSRVRSVEQIVCDSARAWLNQQREAK